MKYSEATKAIQGLSKKYLINNYEDFYSVVYNGLEVFKVYKAKQYFFGNMIEYHYFDKLPYSHKLWMIIAELAMTPISEREENKWNVIVGNDDSEGYSIVVWGKSTSDNGYILYLTDPDYLTDYEAVFTDKEFSKLIKYIKTLPDGEWQAKVAEHGKTEVKGELK